MGNFCQLPWTLRVSILCAWLSSYYFGYMAIGADLSQVGGFQGKAVTLGIWVCSTEWLVFCVKVAIAVMIAYQYGAPEGCFTSSTNAGLVDHLCRRQAHVVPTYFVFSFHYHHIFLAPSTYYWTHNQAMLRRKIENKVCLISHYCLSVIWDPWATENSTVSVLLSYTAT